MGFFGGNDDKKKPDFSNVQSGSSTSAPSGPKPPTTPQPSGTAGITETHVVGSGESLSKIAKQYYGDANEWHRIYDANRDQLNNPDLIKPGQRLKIPGK